MQIVCAIQRETDPNSHSETCIERKCCYSSMAVAHLKYPHSVSGCRHRPRVTFYVHTAHAHIGERRRRKNHSPHINTHERDLSELKYPIHHTLYVIAVLSLCSHFRCIHSVYVCTPYSICVRVTCMWVCRCSFLPLLALQIQIVAYLLSISFELCRLSFAVSVSAFALRTIFLRVHLVLCMHLAHTRHI